MIRPLSEPDEGRYGEVAREMVASGDWLLPRQSGVVYPDKPPGAYWAMAISVSLLGPTPFAIRLPALLAFLGTLLLLAAVERRSGRNGPSPLLLVTSPLLLVLGQLASLDMLLTFFTTAAILDLHRLSHEPSRGRSCRAGFALGAAFLIKGPVGWIIPILVVCTGIWAEGRIRTLGKIFWLGLLSCMLLLGLPWYFAAARIQPGLMDFWLGRELLDRVTSNAHGRDQAWWFFPALACLASFPWAFGFFARPRSKASSSTRFMAIWALLPVLLFSLPASKQPGYLAPAVPGFALWLASVWSSPIRRKGRQWLASAWVAVILVAVVWHLDPENTRSDDPLAETLQMMGAQSWAGGQWNGWSYGLSFRLQRANLKSFGPPPKAWNFARSHGLAPATVGTEQARRAALAFFAQDDPAFLVLHGKRALGLGQRLAEQDEVFVAWRGPRNTLVLNRHAPGVRPWTP